MLAALILPGAVSCGGNQISPDTEPGSTPAVTAEETAAAPEKITIISADGKTEYSVVRSDSADADETSIVTKFVHNLEKKAGVSFTYTTDWDRNPLRRDKEIIVGIPDADSGRVPGKELLGAGGYSIIMDGDKLYIAGGDRTGLESALDAFLGLASGGETLEFDGDFELMHSGTAIFEDVTVDGFSLGGFTIGDGGTDYEKTAADMLRKTVFGLSGKLMKRGGEGTVKFVLDSERPNEVSLSVSGGILTVRAGYRVGFCRALRALISDRALESTSQGGKLVLEGAEKDFGRFITYEDYGAKGNGITDDIGAIAAAHEAANAAGLPVLAREDATYYIGGSSKYAVIKTDTDWSVAHFIIDDTDVDSPTGNVFLVYPDYPEEKPEIKKVSAGAANLGVQPGYPMTVALYNDNVKQYIRQGANQDSGASMTDIVVIDAEGNVDPRTPVLWDFEEITRISARRCDDRQITLYGGIITTIASCASVSTYYNRGIRITRSNTVVDSLTHYVTGEGQDGPPYSGILNVAGCNNVTVKNTVLTGHKTYKKIGSAGTLVSMGTYDMLVTSCTGFTAIDCTQTNDINDSTYWGVFASNYAKNIRFENCVFSRFDAHKGVCNVELSGCTLGHHGINLIGHGRALIENCKIFSTNLVNLRSDYGSTWNGTLEIRDCEYIPGNGKSSKAVIINGSNDGTHDFGYECTLPSSIVIDGLTVRDKAGSSGPYLFAAINPNYMTAPRQIRMPDSVTVSRFSSDSGRPLALADNPAMFPGVIVEFVGNSGSQ